MKPHEHKSGRFKEILITLGVIVLLGLATVIICIAFSSKKDENTEISSSGSSSVTEVSSSNDKPEDEKTENKKVIKKSSLTDTGNLSENADTYEGREGTGDYNYGEALQKAILFYDMQRSGDLPEKTRCNWRGDSGLNDGSDAGIDLTGGFYDAGDNVKFNLPMAYTSAMLAWSLYEDTESYDESGQTEYILDNIKWVNDYLIKCHPEDDVYYYQVGDGSLDHAWWGPCEVMQMERPSYKVDKDNPGSAVSAEAAASLAACSIVFSDEDSKYSKECLSHAKQLYDFAEKTQSDEGYTAANGYYNSWSGFYDELSWAGVWLYMATDDKDYLKKSEKYFDMASGNYKWSQCWDDVYMGSCLLIAQQTNDKKYSDIMEKNLDYWTTGCDGEQITYTPDGLAWLDQWGSLRYATTEAFLAGVYSEYKGCTKSKKDTYWDFAVSQVNYALGSSGRSYVVGFGENSPVNPHHRTSHCSWANNMNEPAEEAHTLYGALVGGPDNSDGYTDEISNYVNNEVACDYNAGFVGALAKLYKKNGGKTLVNFGAVEKIDRQELYTEECINASGADFTEVKAIVYNKSAWPARTEDNLELRYFIDLSELYSAGGSSDDVEVSVNYSQDEVSANLTPWNEEKHIYYVSVDFAGIKIYPGGQESYKKEVQFRIKSNNGTWDNSNDFSYKDIEQTSGNSLVSAQYSGLYSDGKLVSGSEPDGKSAANNHSDTKDTEKKKTTSKKENTPEITSSPKKSACENGDLKVEINQEKCSGTSNTITFDITITNMGTSPVPVSDLNIIYYFAADDTPTDSIKMWCDASAITSQSDYTPVEGVTGGFSELKTSEKTADTACTISSSDKKLIGENQQWKTQIRISKSDWSDFDLGNDYSAGNAKNIVIKNNSKVISGNEIK